MKGPTPTEARFIAYYAATGFKNPDAAAAKCNAGPGIGAKWLARPRVQAAVERLKAELIGTVQQIQDAADDVGERIGLPIDVSARTRVRVQRSITSMTMKELKALARRRRKETKP